MPTSPDPGQPAPGAPDLGPALRPFPTGRDGHGLRTYVPAADASPADVVRVHREVLRVLRPAVDAAHVDAYSGDVWPAEVLPAYERALSLAREGVRNGTRRRRADPGMGIDIDVRDDGQFAVLSALAPYTIHAEAWCGGRIVFSADDTGTGMWCALTPEQEADLAVVLSPPA
ncbi:hypothetical protein [Actinacidiphila acidipaludis]|uniref:Uncharacterized protein n=1 Tax=Actinacidiphila acidipaludis TaxID=2873382 RepID=A0ABS7QAH2_9ACTN|nr:hypothetical protein [Streptomyces acidipaludis]MBY8878972.1 hypothetical protein [Streptomyces acidipaludis]